MALTLNEMTQIWSKTLGEISKKINDKIMFDSFFANSYINNVSDNTITIVVNSKLAVQLMQSKYSDLITSIINDITDETYKIEYISKDEVVNSQHVKAEVKEEKHEYFKNAVIKKDLTFDNFVVGDFNREANQAALIAASNAGSMFNPLFIHSNSGLGKTHLLHSIGNYILKERNPNAKIIYITSSDFVEEYIKYVKGEHDSNSLKDFFKDVDVLLFDDVQFLAEKVKSEEMFFSIYNELYNQGKRIVITSDKQPNELRGLEERLVSRFNSGLIVKINDPDQDTCVEILKKKITANGLDINRFDDDVLDLLADKFSKNVRELEGALNRLTFYAMTLQSGDKITLEVATNAVQSLVGGKSLTSQITERKIINTVANYYNLSAAQLTGTVRTGQIALARHIAMYLIRIHLDAPLKKIGATFGGKDHTTVMNALSKVEKELKTDDALKVAIDELNKRIKK